MKVFEKLLTISAFLFCVTAFHHKKGSHGNCTKKLHHKTLSPKTFDKPAEFYLKFYLYTRENANVRQEIKLNDAESLKSSKFNPNHPVRIIIHGWSNNANAQVCEYGKDEYLTKGDFNVIIVDWEEGANRFYPFSMVEVLKVGPLVADFIEFIIKTYEGQISLASFYVIGFSLGAHVAGVTGKHIKNGKLPVIIGLDPAGPLILASARLDKNDAEYVEVIHTNGGSIMRGDRGYFEPLGTADFYANFGKEQPGCTTNECDHDRAWEYWVESINSEKGFWSFPIASFSDIEKRSLAILSSAKVPMGGEPVNIGKASGIYYFGTREESPFAIGRV